MEKFINSIRKKNIHVVGVTGSEGSSILRFLVKNGVENITVHDFLNGMTLEKSFRLWHKGVNAEEKSPLFVQFEKDISLVKLHIDTDYLADISEADMIFVPQSWRLYPGKNAQLEMAVKKRTPVYSLTRLYLELSPATVIGVTGTVGKGSTANLISQMLANILPGDKKVYSAGNDTWKIQLADKLDLMSKDDYLVLEISHRQLLDGVLRAPHIMVVTNIYPNHLDEVSWEEYIRLKLILTSLQKHGDFSVLNRNIKDTIGRKPTTEADIIYFGSKIEDMSTNYLKKLFQYFMNTKTDQFIENIMAAGAVAEILDINLEQLVTTIPTIGKLPARLELLGKINGVSIYDDIKSTTPWATNSAVNKLGKGVFLICGGETKGIDYRKALTQINKKVGKIFILDSPLKTSIHQYTDRVKIIDVGTLEEALKQALGMAKPGDNLLVSPAAAFFYSKFIKGKLSLRKIFTSLPQAVPVSGDQG